MYDFQTVINRRHTNSEKWAVKASELPMNLADMDFATAPEIIAACQKKLTQGIFGYEQVPTEYYQAVANWYEHVHHFQPQTKWMLFCNGVVPATSSIIRRLTNVGDQIVVQPPVYNIFYHSIENNGRRTLANDLIYHNGTYQINFEQLKQQLADPLTTLMLLCNPQNPSGRIWSRAELIQISQLCQQYQVTLLSDEIHGDLIIGNQDYTPIFSLPTQLIQQTIALVSPSKTFNVAALHAATAIIPNDFLRQQVQRGLNNDELAEPNFVAIPGTIAAYTKGQAWLEALIDQLQQNYRTVVQFCQQYLPEIKVINQGATYLLWLDCTALGQTTAKLAAHLQQTVGLLLSPGEVYRGNGAQFLRLNIACPPVILQAGLERLQKGMALVK